MKQVQEQVRSFCLLCRQQDLLIEQQEAEKGSENPDFDKIKDIEMHIRQRGKTLKRTWANLEGYVQNGVVSFAELQELLRTESKKSILTFTSGG